MCDQQDHDAASTDLHTRLPVLLLPLVPTDGSSIGNTALRRGLEAQLASEGLTLTEDDYWRAHGALVEQGLLRKGQGRGGSVRRAQTEPPPVAGGDLADGVDGFALQAQATSPSGAAAVAAMPAPQPIARRAHATTRLTAADGVPQIIAYRHADRRVNNPEVGMVTPATDPEQGKTRWRDDPHLDPALAFDPQRAGLEALIDDALASGDAAHTDPGDLVLDPTCGSGTTAFVAEKWGRRWISCDTSRVAVTLARQRLMTASYDYYALKYPHEGLKGDRYEVEVHGFDYFDTVKGELVSGGKSRIAMWALDTDYDDRSLFPRQVFFPMAGKGEGWEKLKKDIRAELDESRLHAFHGTVSQPFEAGENGKIAVKIVDDRGIESLKVIALGD